MKGFTEVFAIARTDKKAYRHRTRGVFFLILISMTIFLVVNMLFSYVIDGAESIMNKPYGRTVSIIVNSADKESEMEQICDSLDSMEAVGQIFWHIAVQEVKWENANIIGVTREKIQLASSIDAMQDYVTEGSARLQQGEILVPKYLYDIGIYDDYHYADGSELIGTTVDITVNNRYTDETKSYSFVVAGVYDNIEAKCSSDIFCLSQEDALNIFEYINCYQEEIYIEELANQYGIENKEELEDLKSPHYVGLYIKTGYDMQTVMAQIEEKTGESVFLFMRSDEVLVEYYDFIRYMCNFLMGMFLFLAALVILAAFWKDINERKEQMALRMTLGYTLKLQMFSFLLEKLQLFLKAVLCSLFLDVCFIFAGNYIIQHWLAFYLKSYKIQFSIQAFAVIFLGSMLEAAICIALVLFEVRKISPAQMLKKERGKY